MGQSTPARLFSMRLTLVLVFTTLGIVAKAEPEPAPDPLTVKAHVAVKVKPGSTGYGIIFPDKRMAQDPSGETGGKRSSRKGVECEKKPEYKEIVIMGIGNWIQIVELME